MEGVTDWAMRDLLTSVGGIDQCVTEFLRITDQLMPPSVFYKNCPELKTNSKTRAGTPVFIQLLGGQARPLAENAARAAELGALGIDLNFGCPAPTVNRHDGGATLLKSTDRLFEIVQTVRAAVPKNIPVTAKIRLGFDDPHACLANAQAIEAAGAQWLTVHCRTKTDGYKPPAYWEWISKIKAVTKIQIVTNGEIWTTADFLKCYATAQTNDYMIGRGALRDPYLFNRIKDTFSDRSLNETTFLEVKTLIPSFYDSSAVYLNEQFAVARTKGWMKQLCLSIPEFKDIFEEVKVLTKPHEFKSRLEYLLN
ncbi:MAG: tRNA-dihydrouridine synthase family protein [Bdellovibrionaceae bacterium]|nr:tRNA-dihydrouridine synthase family protein [Bdellovibrio sp.]